MNVISKTIDTLTCLVDANVASYKVSFDIRTRGHARDLCFINSFYIGDDQVIIWTSGLLTSVSN